MSSSVTAAPAIGASVPTHGRATSPMRKVALYGGIAYLVTFAASIPQLKLYADLVDDPAAFVSGVGSNTAVQWGSLLEVVTALSSVATAVLLYPATRRVSRTAAIGFVSSRLVEAGMILVGVVSVLAVVTMRGDFAGATSMQAEAMRTTSEALVALRQWTFLVGPGLMAGINGLFLGYVMYRGRLVPRIIPTIGLIGAPLIIMSATVTILGGWTQMSTTGALCALPIAIWEFSLGIYLTVKGFKNEPAAPTPR